MKTELFATIGHVNIFIDNTYAPLHAYFSAMDSKLKKPIFEKEVDLAHAIKRVCDYLELIKYEKKYLNCKS